MPSPDDSDRPGVAPDATVVRSPDQSAKASPPSTTDINRTVTVAAPPLTEPPSPPVRGYDATATFQVSRFQAAVPGSDSPPSGQAIRNLHDWIEHNREAIDVGEYKLLRAIGTGAFGTVWEAHNFETGEHVAIKFLSAGDLRWEAMLAEVKFLQAMEGTGGIVTVKQVRRGSETQPPYYVMPKANGGSLADWIEETRNGAEVSAREGGCKVEMRTEEVVRIFTRVTTALAAVHRRGIHHCDLKPRNILLHAVLEGDRPDPLIADFGQAHLATDDTSALGTFFYMPPDQAETALRQGEAGSAEGAEQAVAPLQRNGSDSSWDVYALGAVFYEMLTGEPPRKSEGLLKELKGTHHLESKLVAYREGVKSAPPPVAHRQLVDPLLAGIIDRCLSLDPAGRPRDAGEVAALLRHRSWWQHFKPLMLRAGIITLSFIMLIAMLSLWVSSWMYEQTKTQVRDDVQDSVVQAAWYGKQVVEDRLQSHVAFAETAAASDQAPRNELEAAAMKYPTSPGFKLEQAPNRAPFDRWLLELRGQLIKRWGDEKTPTLTVVVCCGDPGYGYIISRLQANGKLGEEEYDDAEKLFTTNFAFRDYYHGHGDKDPVGKYSPIRRTHISQTYHSIVGDRPWWMDIATPIWSSGKPGERKVVGLLRLGINVEKDLASQLYVQKEQLPPGFRVPDGFDVILIDNQDRWVYHRKGMEFLAEVEERTGTKPNPHRYNEVIETSPQLRSGGQQQYEPWKAEPGDFWQGEYSDPIEIATGGPKREAFACAARLQPYALSSQAGGDDDRRWTLVVKMDKETALEPVSDLRINMFLAGAILVIALAALAVVLWIWLFRLLRGWEFAAHG